jgi:hypothetical protein
MWDPTRPTSKSYPSGKGQLKLNFSEIVWRELIRDKENQNGIKPDIVAPVCNAGTWEAETGGS